MGRLGRSRRPKRGSRRPQIHPRRPKRGPRALQDGPRALQDGPRSSKSAPRRPKMASRRPKRAPRRPKRLSRGPPRGPEKAKNIDFSFVFQCFQGSRSFGPRTAQYGSRWLPDRSKTAQEAPSTNDGVSNFGQVVEALFPFPCRRRSIGPKFGNFGPFSAQDAPKSA